MGSLAEERDGEPTRLDPHGRQVGQYANPRLTAGSVIESVWCEVNPTIG